jgi:hypothetical protein
LIAIWNFSECSVCMRSRESPSATTEGKEGPKAPGSCRISCHLWRLLMISHLRHVLRRPPRRQRHSLVGDGLDGQSPATFQIAVCSKEEDGNMETFTLTLC